MPEPATSLTELLHRAQQGDQAAMRGVLEAMYDDLRSLARQRLRGHRRGTYLDTTALVHESFLRFMKLGRLVGDDRANFMRYSSQVMRSIVVDYARERLAERRGSGATPVDLATHNDPTTLDGEAEIVRVHEALESLARHDERMAQVVELRYFAGLNEAEIADVLKVAERTVRREWAKAKVWLAAAMH
jgi:RNA polymerase sigma factor (TIGR02999 family)